MRPVTKGNPQGYSPPNDVMQSIQFLQLRLQLSRLRNKHPEDAYYDEIEGIKKDLRDRNIMYANLPKNATADLKGAFEQAVIYGTDTDVVNGLRRAFEQGLSSGRATDEDLLLLAQRLIFVLELLRTDYLATLDSHNDKIKKVYVLARRDLITNIGQYCSYCEMPLGAALAVEHTLPKDWFPRASVEWANFLLACPICNSIKSNKPSINDGTAALQAAGQTPPYTYEQIADGARSLYLWPSDAAHYPSFESAFQYQLYKVLYDFSNKVIKEQLFTQPELDLFVRNRLIQKADQTDGHTKVRVFAPLFQIDSSLSANVIKFLQNITIGNGMSISAENVSTVPQLLIDGFKNFVSTHVTNTNWYHVNLGTDPNVRILRLLPDEWQLTQVSQYQISTLNNKIALYDETGTRLIHRWDTNIAPLRSALVAGNLPDAVAEVLGIDQFSGFISTYPSERRAWWGMIVQKKYLLKNDHNTLQVYADQIFSAELRLAPANGDARGKRIIDDTGLNRNDLGNQQRSDRRMARRIYTWFTAIESLQNLYSTLQILDTHPRITADLIQFIIQTAQLTGFWTVWLYVFRAYPPPTSIVGPLLLRELKNPANFAGTR
jgi:Reovirus core-spike protein lambda-2 (L2)